MNGYFLVRFGYVFVCWGILFIPIQTAENEFQMFSSLMLFFLPLGLDYWTHIPKDSDDKKRKYIGVVLPLVIFCIFFVIFIMSSQINMDWLINWYIKYPIWTMSGFFVWLSLRDFISYSSDEEIYNRKNTREKQRERAFNWRLEEEQRRDHYQKTKMKQHVAKQTRPRQGRKRKRG